jgi:hypothetical protein
MAEAFAEYRIALGLAADRTGVAADVASGPGDAAAAGDEGADFTELGFVEGAGAAGRRRGAGSWEHGGGLRLRISDWGLMAAKSTKRHKNGVFGVFRAFCGYVFVCCGYPVDSTYRKI